MELLKRRPLCTCCALFLIFSYFCAHLVFEEKVLLSLISLVLAILFLLIGLIFNVKRYGFFCLVMCFLFIFGAFANNFLRIDLSHNKAKQYTGNHTATMHIIGSEHYSEHSSSYVVDVATIDGEKSSLRAVLVLGFGAERLLVGDTLYADVEFYEMNAKIMGQTGYQRTDREDVSLVAALYDVDSVMVEKFDRSRGFFNKLFSSNGIAVILDDMRSLVKFRIYECVGEDVGGIANAYLTGDRTGLSSSTVRDYRRAGISHLFAVSGLHVSILLGAIERLLKKLYCSKTIRCVILSVCAFGLLCLTGFSMSAMRSVFMLLMVYIAFWASEENDAPTSLFLSVVVIILITPYAIYELGMWMSFLATLGVITVYPMMQNVMPRFKKKSRVKKILLAALRSCCLTAVGTISATMLLLPISWSIFGELSVVAIPANIVMSPLSTIFLVLSALAALFGNAPFISFLIRCISVAVSSLMTFFTDVFSDVDIATVSLRYPFAKWLVIVFSIILVVMLLVKVPKKILFAVPPIAFTISFFVCVMCFNAINPLYVCYKGNEHREVISVSNDDSLAIIDMSDGYYSRFYDALEDASAYGATQVESIVLTSVSPTHVSSLDYFLRNSLVKTLYIPEPYSMTSRELSIKLATIAQSCGVEVKVYNGSSPLAICDGVQAKIICSANKNKRSVAVFVANRDKIFGYVDAFVDGSERADEVNTLIKKCDTVVIGNNGVPVEEYSFEISDDAKIIYSSKELMLKSKIKGSTESVYFNTHKIFNFKIAMD